MSYSIFSLGHNVLFLKYVGTALLITKDKLGSLTSWTEKLDQAVKNTHKYMKSTLFSTYSRPAVYCL